jgi:exo-beta-1,3-glucanase (GH17 family)
MNLTNKIPYINLLKILFFGLLLCCGLSCKKKSDSLETNLKNKEVTAKDILGNSEYLAISYGGYRANSRRVQPTIIQLKDDLKILSAMGVKTIRTYNVHLPEAINILKAIDELSKEDKTFEMYVMLGAWIDCKNAWTGFEPNHNEESERNTAEIAHAVELAQKYPEIIKVIAVGNEAMVKWAAAYYVQPSVILKWVNHLQDLKKNGKLSKELWITSSDNFASWGGGTKDYHVEDLKKLIHAVDYISMHTYPMHDTHYNPVFWGIKENEMQFSIEKKIDLMMDRSVEYAKSQYDAVKKYMESVGVNKPIHIGETGWATYSNEMYGNEDSKAVDEYKAAIFYHKMREWTTKEKIACFYFEAFDEPWKDAGNPGGSENHFGLFTVEGNAKYAVWDLVDNEVFKDLKRDGNTIQKTYNGNKERLLKEVQLPGILK